MNGAMAGAAAASGVLSNSQIPRYPFHFHKGGVKHSFGAAQETDSDAMSWVGLPPAPSIRQLLGSPAGQAQMLTGHLH